MIELARGHNAAAEAALSRSAAIGHDPLVLARLAVARGNNDEAQKWFAEAAKRGSAEAHLALAGGMSALAVDLPRAAAMGLAGRERALAEFPPERSAGRIEQLYRAALGSDRR